MNLARAIQLCLLLAALVASPVAQPPPRHGYCLPMTIEDREFNYAPLLSEIREQGANSVALVLPYYQRDAVSSQIHAKENKTPSSAVLADTIREARAFGLEVLVYPIVLLEDENGKDWRGSLRPADRDEWFQSYATHLLSVADLADTEGASMLAVGSEFTSLQHDEARWRALCAQVRPRYRGTITYVANWDAPDDIPWWDAVDEMGISAYYELAGISGDEPTTESLTAECMKWRDWLLEIREKVAPGKRIAICELGYPSVMGGASLPWDYARIAQIDAEEQRRAFEAFIRTWDGNTELSACFVYAWHEPRRDPHRGYTPRGKPAAELLRSWYDGAPAY